MHTILDNVDIGALQTRLKFAEGQLISLMDKRIIAEEERDRLAKRVADMTRALDVAGRAMRLQIAWYGDKWRDHMEPELVELVDALAALASSDSK